MKIVWPVLSVIIALVLFISSSIPSEISGAASRSIAAMAARLIPLSMDTWNFLVRKAAHFIMFFSLGFCVAQALKFHIRSVMRVCVYAWIIASLYGVVDEIHQYFVPGRVFSVADMVLNASGALVGVGIVWLMLRGKDRNIFL